MYPVKVSVNEDGDIADFIKASLKEFRLNDISSADVSIRNHEEIRVGRPVKELITGSGNSDENPFFLYHAENITEGN